MTDVRSDIVAFARDVLGIGPFEHQLPALRSTAPYVVLAGGRRSTKSTTAQIKALHACFTHPGGEWLVTSAKEDNARRFVSEAADLLRGELARDSVVDELASRLTLANGAALVAVSPTSASLRGAGRRLIGLTWEEAGFCPAGTFRDGRYALLDNRAEGAQGWLIGSPWRPAPDHFFHQCWRAGMDGDPDFESFQWRTEMNPRLPTDFIARERERLNSLEAAAELDGEWTDDGERFFPPSLLETCVADVELPEPGALRRIRPIGGFDYGLVYDHSAGVLLARGPVAALNPDRLPVPTFMVVPHVWRQGEELRQVVEDVVGWRIPFAYVASEVVGLGAMPSQELRRRLHETQPGLWMSWLSVATSAPLKLAAYGLVRWLLERGQLILPRDPRLLREMAGIRVEQAQRGAKIGADDPSVHDDVCDALAFAMLPRLHNGRTLCHTSKLADPVLAVPDAKVPPLEEETVETGAGVRVYRRPPLQSVDGTRFVLPPGVAQVEDRAREDWSVRARAAFAAVKAAREEEQTV